MYQSAFYDKENSIVHIWDDEKGYIKHNYRPYGYVEDPKGEFTDLFGKKCSKTFDLKKAKIETDVPADTRTLIDLYFNSDDISKDIRILKFDIEVEKGEKHSSPEEAKNRITSIAVKDNIENRYKIFILDESQIIDFTDKNGADIISCPNEETLLKKFLKYHINLAPHIIVGWNSNYYDIPYLYNRLCNLFGERIASKLSPIGIVKRKPKNSTGGNAYQIAGISSLDYMELYQNFTYSEEPSYALESISQKELKRGKVKYDGDLDHLYKTNINKFIDYNICDVELIDALDTKLQFIALARAICHKGHVPYDNIYFASSYLEGASLTFTKKLNIVTKNKPSKIALEVNQFHKVGSTEIRCVNKINKRVPGAGMLRIYKSKTSSFVVEYHSYKDNVFFLREPLPFIIKPEYDITLSLIGAYVKEPIPGKYKWIFDLDLTSLYPSIIMTLNISPETKIGKILNWNANEFVRNTEKTYHFKLNDNKVIEYTAEKFKDYLVKNNFSIAGNGVVYDQKVKGFIPQILEKWFNERVEFKDLMKVYGKKGDDAMKNYYHTLQLVQKTMLNSFYGVLALTSFRFNDLDNAEAVTSSGQQIIKFTANCANKWFKNKLQPIEPTDYVTYSDTDSTFISALPLMLKFNPDVDTLYKKITNTSYLDFNVDFYKDNTNNIHDDFSGWLLELIKEGKKLGYLGNNSEFRQDDKNNWFLHTDSNMKDIPIFKFQVFLKSKYTPLTAIKELKVIDLVIGYATQIQKYINTEYTNYCRLFHNVTNKHKLEIKQEYVAKSGLWVAKKRYAQWVVDNEGIPVNKLDVKGLDVVRSNFPQEFRKFMTKFLEDVLNDVDKLEIINQIKDLKERIPTLPIMSIMNPTSVKDITKHIGASKGVPVHVKSAINYNKLLAMVSDKTYTPIVDGDKVRWTYVKKNKFGFETMAVKGFGDHPKIFSFVEKTIDYDQIFESNLTGKLQDFFDALKWGEVNLNEAQMRKFFTVK